MGTGLALMPLVIYFIVKSNVISDGLFIVGILLFVFLMIPFLLIMGVQENIESMRIRRF
jgi:hypothetical protein